jgi:hypothetical protein
MFDRNYAYDYAQRFANVTLLDDCDVTPVTGGTREASFAFDDAIYVYSVTVKRIRKADNESPH